VLYAIAQQPFFRMFTPEDAVHGVPLSLLPFLVAAILFYAVQSIILHSLRAAREQLMAAARQVTAYLGHMVPADWPSHATIWHGGRGLTLGFLIGLAAAALMLGLRFFLVTRRLSERFA